MPGNPMPPSPHQLSSLRKRGRRCRGPHAAEPASAVFAAEAADDQAEEPVAAEPASAVVAAEPASAFFAAEPASAVVAAEAADDEAEEPVAAEPASAAVAAEPASPVSAPSPHRLLSPRKPRMTPRSPSPPNPHRLRLQWNRHRLFRRRARLGCLRCGRSGRRDREAGGR